MNKWIGILVALAALTLGGCVTSANRVRGAEPFFKNADRSMIYQVPKPVAQGDMEEGGELSPYALSDPRTDHNPGLLNQGGMATLPQAHSEAAPAAPLAPPALEGQPEEEYEAAEKILSPPDTTEDSDEGVLGTVMNWVVPRTTLMIVNGSTCVAEISVNSNRKVQEIPPMGGRRSVDLAGRVGSEGVIVAAARCWVFEPSTGEWGWNFQGIALHRICAPYEIDRVEPWIISQSDFTMKPTPPAPCQGPEPSTYPYYPAGGWSTWGGGWGRRGVSININNRRGWRSY